MARILTAVFSLFLFVHGSALAQDQNASPIHETIPTESPEPSFATDRDGFFLPPNGVNFSSIGTMQVPVVTTNPAKEGPRAGSDSRALSFMEVVP